MPAEKGGEWRLRERGEAGGTAAKAAKKQGPKREASTRIKRTPAALRGTFLFDLEEERKRKNERTKRRERPR